MMINDYDDGDDDDYDDDGDDNKLYLTTLTFSTKANFRNGGVCSGIEINLAKFQVF